MKHPDCFVTVPGSLLRVSPATSLISPLDSVGASPGTLLGPVNDDGSRRSRSVSLC